MDCFVIARANDGITIHWSFQICLHLQRIDSHFFLSCITGQRHVTQAIFRIYFWAQTVTCWYYEDLFLLNAYNYMKTYLLTCAHNKDSNHPAHPRSLIRSFIVRIKILDIIGYLNCAQWKFWSHCEIVQTDLNLLWAQMSDGTFSDWWN